MNNIGSDISIYIYIFKYLDNISCCKISSINNITLVSKYFNKIIKDNNLLIKFKNILLNNQQEIKFNIKNICPYHTLFDDCEIKKIKYIIKQTSNKYKYNNNYDLTDYIDSHDSVIFIHFDNITKKNNFIKKYSVSLLKLNITGSCCENKGIRIEL